MKRNKQKIGRNAPCPCGSGKKYKKCCLFAKEAWQLKPIIERENEIKQNQRADKYGWVRPIIHEKFRGKRFIAVGSKLHYSDKWETMTDFLTDYLKLNMGKDWWLTEAKKTKGAQHPIMRWAIQMYEHQKKYGVEEKNGLTSVEPNGPTMAYLTLAYDLYVLQDNQAFQKKIIKRLKRLEHFEGARYELYVAATMVRAGFSIDYEDDKDGTKKHPEFIAKHKTSNLQVAVEAKKRHRPDLIEPKDDGFDIKLGIKDLFAKAVNKFDGVTPYIIFLDLNLPPIEGNPFEKEWFEELKASIDESKARDADGLDKFNITIFTSYPVEYALETPPCHNHIHVISQKPKLRLDTRIINSVVKSVSQSGIIPSFLDE